MTMLKNRLMKLTLAGLMVVTFMEACQNDDHAIPSTSENAVIDHDKLAALVVRTSQVSDASEDEAITAEYKSLTSKELDYFNDLRVQYDLDLLERTYNDPASQLSSGRISEAEFESAKNSIILAGQLRKQLNQLAKERYGLTGSNINSSQIENLTNELLLTDKYSVLSSLTGFTETNNNAKTQACTVVSLPRRAYKGVNSGVGWFTYYRAQWNIQTDCDYIFAYHGDRNHMRGETYWNRAMIDDFGGVLPQRYTGASDILMGYWRVIAYIGYPGLVNVTMRWGA